MKEGKFLGRGRLTECDWRTIWATEKAGKFLNWVQEIRDEIFMVCDVTETEVSQSMNKSVDATDKLMNMFFSGEKIEWEDPKKKAARKAARKELISRFSGILFQAEQSTGGGTHLPIEVPEQLPEILAQKKDLSGGGKEALTDHEAEILASTSNPLFRNG